MDIPIFKIFMIFGIVSSWAAKALADGKVTLVEAVELATQLAGALGITLAIEVPNAIGPGSDITVDEEAPAGETIKEAPAKQRPPDN